MGKCAKGGSFQVSSCKTLQTFIPFVVSYLMLLDFVHKLKCETNLTFYVRNPTSTFRNDNVFGPLVERLPQKFNIHPCASYLSIC